MGRRPFVFWPQPRTTVLIPDTNCFTKNTKLTLYQLNDTIYLQYSLHLEKMRGDIRGGNAVLCTSPVRKLTLVNVSAPVEGGVAAQGCSRGAGRAGVARGRAAVCGDGVMV